VTRIRTVVVAGDSIAAGLGARGRAYSTLIAEHYEADLINLAATARQVTESVGLLETMVESQPDIVILAHGITEAIVRPTSGSLWLVPLRWRAPGWMDPRPYYSTSFRLRVLQKLESALRWRVKVLLLRSMGGTTWESEEEYEQGLSTCVKTILDRTSAFLVLVSPCSIDERYFPGSAESLDRYYRITLSVHHMYPSRTRCVDVRRSLHRWDDFLMDQFHPNESGHQKIASIVTKTLDSCLG